MMNDDVQNDSICLSTISTKVIDTLACVLVLLSHFGSYLNLRIFAPLGAGGVSIFLMLSGYGLVKSTEKNALKCFWRKRIQRVLVPYWVIRAVIYLYMLLVGTKIDIVLLILDITLIQPLGPNCWYLFKLHLHVISYFGLMRSF